MFLKYGLLQVLSWNNDTTVEKMDDCNWSCQKTDFFQCIHGLNQGDIIISNYDISLLQFLLCKNTVNLKKNQKEEEKEPFIEKMAATGIAN